jgi:hypothetical protein
VTGDHPSEPPDGSELFSLAHHSKGFEKLMTVSTAIMTIYTRQRLHNFTHRLVISSLAKRLGVSILLNVHFLWCTTRRSPQFSQHFPAHKTSKLRFHRCRSHILQKPPLVPWLGDKPTSSPKSRKSHPVLLPRTSVKLGK